MTREQVERKLDRLARRRAVLKHQATRLVTNARIKSEDYLAKTMSAAQRKAHVIEITIHKLDNEIDFLKEKLGLLQLD